MQRDTAGCITGCSGHPLPLLKKIYIISGEASGDLHGANLISSMRSISTDLDFRVWGGERMEAEGATLVKHYKDLAFMGFIEVVMNLRTILGNMKFCKEDILQYKPDAVVLIDYPGFNLRIAEFCHEQGIPVHYYISPQIWAWKENRVHKIKKVVDKMYVILPFEKAFYAKFNVDVDFVGHPLLDVITEAKQEGSHKQEFLNKNGLEDKPIIALLPGSRKQEISTMLPIMLSVMPDFPDHQFVIGAAPSQDESFYRSIIGEKNVKLVEAQTYRLMRYADAGLITSGTATLEAALWGLPEVICYKGSFISYWIARMLVKIKFIGLVNLVMDREVIKELIQADLNRKSLAQELNLLLHDESRRTQLKKDYEQLWNELGGSGASMNVAKMIIESL